jgi:dicarboxylate carrier protein MatC
VSPELVSILVLIAMFAAATLLPVNRPRSCVHHRGAYTDLLAEDIALLFPGDLFVLLVGITYLRPSRSRFPSSGKARWEPSP